VHEPIFVKKLEDYQSGVRLMATPFSYPVKLRSRYYGTGSKIS